jgi:hypothetical protein
VTESERAHDVRSERPERQALVPTGATNHASENPVNAQTWTQKHLSPNGKGCFPSTNTDRRKKPPQNTGKFPHPNGMLIFRQSSAETGYFGICRLQDRVGASPTPPTSTGDGESSRRSRCIVLARLFLSVLSFSQFRQFQPAQFFAFDLSLKLPKGC